MRKIASICVLLLSGILAMYLICFGRGLKYYSQCVVDGEQFQDIISTRTKSDNLLEALVFDEENLFYDKESKIFYYSLIEGNSGAFNPQIEVVGKDAGLDIAFLNNWISLDGIKNNQTIDFVVYTDKEYGEYYLKCTTLPLMNIECSVAEHPDEISDFPLSMNITVFDNRSGATQRLVYSDGTIHIRGVSTREFVKKAYRLSLTQESLAGHVRDNDISLLGMRQDEDWVLYAAYNDQEKIRNVFSCNLWKKTCAVDNEAGIDTGVEYRYLELFINGQYWGLYALGYTIDKKQMKVDTRSGKDALYKVVSWVDRNLIGALGGEGYELKGSTTEDEGWDQLLIDYYNILPCEPCDNYKLYAGMDIDNAIDLYLFFNLIQGADNVSVNFVKNMYVAIRTQEDGRLVALYAPWDLDISWGNQWAGVAEKLLVRPYWTSSDVNYVMESGYLNQLIVNGDEEIWQKIFDKYHSLRADAWSEQNINEMLDEYEADIFGSGAYLRDMERWPDGNYADVSDGLSTFRNFVMERLREADAYYDRQEALCSESVFIRRSAQYKNFIESGFIIELNNKDLLEDTDYIDLFEYMGIDIESITEEVNFIIANPSEGRYDYLPTLFSEEGRRETSIGMLSLRRGREGGFKAYLDKLKCYDCTTFPRPEIQMMIIYDKKVRNFSFMK